MAKVIKVENLSKAYQLGDYGTGTISRDLERFWAKIRGKEDPFLKIGEINDRNTKSASNVIWSLKDINFEINEGDSVGIIGRNGAGKSTLLKILSRVTSPTTGSVKIKGRIASLLEVGTGFHPELSGRENIYLNGAILGMRKAEIKRKFDEIVDFAGVERYIDTPVKRYSSGMYVRLAFAVAAHLESEILIVDEVLAVGDAEFQKKCLGKMGDISKSEGRTVLFVSHNMAAVKKLCSRGMLLSNGQLAASGNTQEIISLYADSSEIKAAVYKIPLPYNHDELIGYASKIQIEDINANLIKEVSVGKPWQIRIFFTLNRRSEHFIIGLGMSDLLDINLRTSWAAPASLPAGDYEAVFREEHLILATGVYNIKLGLSDHEKNIIHYIESTVSLIISDAIDPVLNKAVIRTSNVGLILNPMQITISPL